MVMKRQAYLLVGANVASLPKEVPAWLITMVAGMNDTRHGFIELEQSLSVVMTSDDDEQEKAKRCANLLRLFVETHVPRIESFADNFSIRRGILSPEIATSFGSEIALITLLCTNAKFRADMLSQIADAAIWGRGEACMLMALAQSCRGQGGRLDWIRANLIESPASNTAPDA